jgi:hypothetical protein
VDNPHVVASLEGAVVTEAEQLASHDNGRAFFSADGHNDLLTEQGARVGHGEPSLLGVSSSAQNIGEHSPSMHCWPWQ